MKIAEHFQWQTRVILLMLSIQYQLYVEFRLFDKFWNNNIFWKFMDVNNCQNWKLYVKSSPHLHFSNEGPSLICLFLLKISV